MQRAGGRITRACPLPQPPQRRQQRQRQQQGQHRQIPRRTDAAQPHPRQQRLLLGAVIAHHQIVPAVLQGVQPQAQATQRGRCGGGSGLRAAQCGGQPGTHAGGGYHGGGVHALPALARHPDLGPGVGVLLAHDQVAAVGVDLSAQVAADDAGGQSGGAHQEHEGLRVVFAKTLFRAEQKGVHPVLRGQQRRREGVREATPAQVIQSRLDALLRQQAPPAFAQRGGAWTLSGGEQQIKLQPFRVLADAQAGRTAFQGHAAAGIDGAKGHGLKRGGQDRPLRQFQGGVQRQQPGIAGRLQRQGVVPGRGRGERLGAGGRATDPHLLPGLAVIRLVDRAAPVALIRGGHFSREVGAKGHRAVLRQIAVLPGANLIGQTRGGPALNRQLPQRAFRTGKQHEQRQRQRRGQSQQPAAADQIGWQIRLILPAAFLEISACRSGPARGRRQQQCRAENGVQGGQRSLPMKEVRAGDEQPQQYQQVAVAPAVALGSFEGHQQPQQRGPGGTAQQRAIRGVQAHGGQPGHHAQRPGGNGRKRTAGAERSIDQQPRHQRRIPQRLPQHPRHEGERQRQQRDPQGVGVGGGQQLETGRGRGRGKGSNTRQQRQGSQPLRLATACRQRRTGQLEREGQASVIHLPHPGSQPGEAGLGISRRILPIQQTHLSLRGVGLAGQQVAGAGHMPPGNLPGRVAGGVRAQASEFLVAARAAVATLQTRYRARGRGGRVRLRDRGDVDRDWRGRSQTRRPQPQKI
ncbi:hypothetical protein DEMA109039_14505 [Deinococcus marmoris]